MRNNFPSPDKLAAALSGASQRVETTDFDLNMDLRPHSVNWTSAAVMVPLQIRETGIEVILTKRSNKLLHHPGQVAFPGGKVDPSDLDSKSAAIREAQEEIGLSPSHATILGTLPYHETITGFRVEPFVFWIDKGFNGVAEAGEVSEIFRVPLEHVLDERNFTIETRVWAGVPRRYYTVPFGPYYIWGATARMLRELAHIFEGQK